MDHNFISSNNILRILMILIVLGEADCSCE